MERVTGIEPAWPVWKTGTLPLSYTRINGADITLHTCLVNRGLGRLQSNSGWDSGLG